MTEKFTAGSSVQICGKEVNLLYDTTLWAMAPKEEQNLIFFFAQH